MKCLEADLGFLKQGIAELDEYLHSQEVFWQLSGKRRRGRDDLPLTIGNLLFSLQNLLGRCDEYDVMIEINNLVGLLRSKREVRKSAWIVKAVGEFRKRFTTWKGNLEELLSGAGYASYPVIVRDRVLLDLLKNEFVTEALAVNTLLEKLPKMEKFTNQLELLDEKLKLNSTAGRFVWDTEIEPIFPPHSFWYLYLDIGQ